MDDLAVSPLSLLDASDGSMAEGDAARLLDAPRFRSAAGWRACVRRGWADPLVEPQGLPSKAGPEPVVRTLAAPLAGRKADEA